MKDFCMGIILTFLVFYVLIYFPLSWDVKSDCLEKGYPDYAISRGLVGYCIKGTEVIRVK